MMVRTWISCLGSDYVCKVHGKCFPGVDCNSYHFGGPWEIWLAISASFDGGGVQSKLFFFAGAPPKETICFVIQSSSGCRRDFNSDEPVETIRVAYLQFRKGYNCALAFRS